MTGHPDSQVPSLSAVKDTSSSTSDVAPSTLSSIDLPSASTDDAANHTVTFIADNLVLSDQDCERLVHDVAEVLLDFAPEAVVNAWIDGSSGGRLT